MSNFYPIFCRLLMTLVCGLVVACKPLDTESPVQPIAASAPVASQLINHALQMGLHATNGDGAILTKSLEGLAPHAASLHDGLIRDQDLTLFANQLLNHYRKGGQAHQQGRVLLSQCGNIADITTGSGLFKVRYSSYACFAESPAVSSWVYSMSAEYLDAGGKVIAIELLGPPGRVPDDSALSKKMNWFNDLIKVRHQFINDTLNRLNPSQRQALLADAVLVTADLAKHRVELITMDKQHLLINRWQVVCQQGDMCKVSGD
jgi:hypothetical protein